MSRKDRVEHAMRDELAQMIAREIKDPRIAAAGVVGVARVECTPDFSVAKVYVSIYGDDCAARSRAASTSANPRTSSSSTTARPRCPSS
jgi:ribosome-binding factor A